MQDHHHHGRPCSQDHSKQSSNHANSHSHSQHQGCSHQQVQISPEQYFENIKQMITNKQHQFYWMQIFKGTYLQKKLQAYNCNILASINCQVMMGVIGMCNMMLNFQWMPLRIRPFVSGMFLVIAGLMVMNWKILGEQKTSGLVIMMLPILLYILVALRGSGSMSTAENQQKGKKACEIRPYIQTPPLQCAACKIPKLFRVLHCPMCKQCTPKFSRHSLLFGICIGAANQLLAIFFFLSLIISSGYSILQFVLLQSTQQYGLITKLMFYFINIYTLWASTNQFATLTIMNLYYGLTQFEVQSWVMLQYLMNVPQRSFKNTCNQGFIHNFMESSCALFGIDGYQATLADQNNSNSLAEQQQIDPLNQQIKDPEDQALQFPKLDQNRKYVVNWAKAFMYVIPHMPNHPLRDNLIKLMQKDQPRMIQNFRMMKTFRGEVDRDSPAASDIQKQQRVMMKMQQYMMKNGPPAFMKPPPQQQKAIQLQMISHLKTQFKDTPQLYKQFQELESKLKSSQIDSDQAAIGLRELQGKVMQIKMGKVLEQQQKRIQSKSKDVEVASQSEKYNKKIGVSPTKKSNQSTNLLDQEKKQQQQKPNIVQNRPNVPVGNMPFNMQHQQQQSPMSMPSQQQQKAMILMGISNMKVQFQSDQVISAELSKIQTGLKQSSITIQEASISMRGIQQQIMQKKLLEMTKNGQQNPQQQMQHPPQMMMPSPEQQKSMMLMGIAQMKSRFQSNESIVSQLQKVENGLSDNSITVDQAKLGMQKVQQEIMMKMMQQQQGVPQPPPNNNNTKNSIETDKKQLIDDHQ